MDSLHSTSLLVRLVRGKGTSKKEKDNDAVGVPSVEVERDQLSWRCCPPLQPTCAIHKVLLDLEDDSRHFMIVSFGSAVSDVFASL